MIKWTCLIVLCISTSLYAQTKIYISPSGNDEHQGTLSAPLATLDKALKKVKSAPEKEVHILLRKGVYYLSQTVRIDPDVLADKKLLISSYQNEHVELNGGRKLSLKWKKTGMNIWSTTVDGESFEQLFLNGQPQILARYPNYDSTARILNGTAIDALSKERVSSWKNPAGGYIHALHGHEWGSLHYRITGKKADELMYEGGWQNNRPLHMHPKYRFVENIVEELDVPGEWFYDRNTHILSLIPRSEGDLDKSTVEVSKLKSLIELKGSADRVLSGIKIQGLRFVNSERIFMESYEPLLRSDWMFYRGAAIYIENAENCQIEGCELTNLGGNAIVVSRYNRNISIKDCHIHHIAATAISFVGDSSAVRSPSFRYENFVPYHQMDLLPGPKNEQYPRQCMAIGNLIHHIGQIEKQAAGIQVAMSSDININHNSIYQTPRAGINIGDGTWGGHLIEFNDVFDTVLETGDHGSFNSWGRDRFWHPNPKTMDSLVAAHPELIKLDAQKPVIIRNNRFRCDHGWDIDLDDGSSNYLIYNNVLLNGGLKFREGFLRTAENNVIINNSFHLHVWFENSGDIFKKNIIMRPYYPIRIRDWGRGMDYNLFPDQLALEKAQAKGVDLHSKIGEPQFINAAQGDYRVKKTSPALTLGFKNFPMNQFGTQKPSLRTIALTPKLPLLSSSKMKKETKEMSWLGIKVRNVQGLGDRSTYGLPSESGIIVVDIPKSNELGKAGLKKDDVILAVSGSEVNTIAQLSAIQQQFVFMITTTVRVVRNQQIIDLKLPLR